MAKPKLAASGRWEIGLRHPSLPSGRKYFLFDTEQEAIDYEAVWRKRKLAGIEPPAELLKPAAASVILAQIIRAWENSGLAAPTQKSALGSLMVEVGPVKLEDATYAWLAAYVQRLKVKNNIAPGTVRHRIQGLGRCIDEYLRNNPKVVFSNPVRLLPKGYSTYSAVDKKLVLAVGGKAKTDVSRDRRLHKGEDARIVAVLQGEQRPGTERGLMLKGGNALLTMYLLIVNSGMRLREAYTLRRSQIDLAAKVIHVQASKQWRGKIAFRDTPMSPAAHAALVHYLSTRAMLPGAYLFPFMDEDGGLALPRVSARLSARFTSAFRYAGIDGLNEHDLRHEATCRWLEMREPSGNWMWRMEEVNRIMGWTPGSVMAQRYASFRGADMAQRMWVTETPMTAAHPGVV